MAERWVNRRDIKFMIEEVFNAEALTQYDYFADHSMDTFNMAIDTALKMSTDKSYPLFQEMDRNPPRYENSQAKVNPLVRPFMDEFGKGGWITADWDYEEGGQQLPNLIKFMCCFIFAGANYSLIAFPLLCQGAANLMKAHASQEIKDQYLEKLCSAKWQGTMALTEPDVGSSLGDLTSSAKETDQGYYLIKGKKIFISAGDTDASENTVHMMLARIQGAPAGVKGISLFVVPKYRQKENEDMVFNDVSCDGIEHKMGYKGCPICQLTMGENGDCHGWLVGAPGKGLSYMFQMMNEERLNVGAGAVAKAMGAYYAALEYTSQRRQGRPIMEKDQTKPMIPIIEHTDVKRMLLMQKGIAEGGLSLCAQVAKYFDLMKVVDDEAFKEKYSLLIELLIPVVKSYPSEAGIISTSTAIQCLGGYGFCQDFPVEQYLRDIRIDPIHEGTTCVQGQDLLGRKVITKQGKAMGYFMEELSQTIQLAAGFDILKPLAQELDEATKELQSVTMHLLGLAGQGKIEEFLADSVLYLEMFGLTAVAWQWLVQAITAQQALIRKNNLLENDEIFYQGKIYTCRFFFSYELNKIYYLAKRLKSTEAITVEMDSKFLQATGY